jgi:hypothetical protein
MLDQARLPWFAELNGSLMDEALSDADFRARLREAAERLTALAQQMLDRALGEHPGLAPAAVAGLRDAIAAGIAPRRDFGPMLFAAVPAPGASAVAHAPPETALA